MPRLENGRSYKEKVSYKLLENGNLSFGKKIAYSTENFKLRKSKTIKYNGLYDLLGDDFLNQSNAFPLLINHPWYFYFKLYLN